jgi:hypothetical protein
MSVPPDDTDPAKIHFGYLVRRARDAGYAGPINLIEAESRARWAALFTEEQA